MDTTGTFITRHLSTFAERFENVVRQRFEERIWHNKFTHGCTDPRLSHRDNSIAARQMSFRHMRVDSLHTHIVNLKKNKAKSSISLIQKHLPVKPSSLRDQTMRRLSSAAF